MYQKPKLEFSGANPLAIMWSLNLQNPIQYIFKGIHGAVNLFFFFLNAHIRRKYDLNWKSLMVQKSSTVYTCCPPLTQITRQTSSAKLLLTFSSFWMSSIRFHDLCVFKWTCLRIACTGSWCSSSNFWHRAAHLWDIANSNELDFATNFNMGQRVCQLY